MFKRKQEKGKGKGRRGRGGVQLRRDSIDLWLYILLIYGIILYYPSSITKKELGIILSIRVTCLSGSNEVDIKMRDVQYKKYVS